MHIERGEVAGITALIKAALCMHIHMHIHIHTYFTL